MGPRFWASENNEKATFTFFSYPEFQLIQESEIGYYSVKLHAAAQRCSCCLRRWNLLNCKLALNKFLYIFSVK